MYNDTLLDNIPLGIMIFDEYSQNISVNLAGAVFCEKTEDCLQNLIIDLVSTALKLHKSIEKIIIYSTEKDFCIWGINARIFADKSPQVMVVIQDVTLNFQLQRTVLKAEKLAVAGQLAIGSLVEIRNPLTIARGFCQFIEGNTAIKPEYIEIIDKELEQINQIIDSGRFDVSIKHTHLEFLYNKIHENLYTQIDTYKLIMVTNDFDYLAINIAEEAVNAITLELINILNICLEENTHIIINVNLPANASHFNLEIQASYNNNWDMNIITNLQNMAETMDVNNNYMQLEINNQNMITINLHLPILVPQRPSATQGLS